MQFDNRQFGGGSRGGQLGRTVCFAGSRRSSIERKNLAELCYGFHRSGFDFLVGCGEGVDRCFRDTVVDTALVGHCSVHCAFSACVHEAETMGLKVVYRVSDVLSPSAALHWRTVLMVRECSLLVLFPDDPTTGSWGKGSRLAFNTAIQSHIPVFVVTSIPPQGTQQIQVEEGSLFGAVDGHWVIPQGVEVRGDESA
jgi:hypothetical protein